MLYGTRGDQRLLSEERTSGRLRGRNDTLATRGLGTRAAVLIFSPHARRSVRGVAALRALEAVGVNVVETLDVSALDHSAPLGGEWRTRGYELVLAAGGDGTIGAVVTQVMGSGLPLGILPLGTSNDSARSLNLPLDLQRAADALVRGVPTEVEVGYVVPAATEPFALSPEENEEADHPASSGGGAYFLHALTLGMNAEFARLATNMVRRRRWGRLNYASAAVEAAMHFEPLSVTIALEGVSRWSALAQPPNEDGTLTLQQRVLQIAAVNLPSFGGDLNLKLRQVQPHDNLLDFVFIEAPDASRIGEAAQSWFESVRHLRSRIGQQNVIQEDGTRRADLSVDIAGFNIPGITRYQARAATLSTLRPVDVTLDGEIRSLAPVHVEVAPEPVRILLPARVDSGA